MTPKFVALAETAQDCENVLGWARRKKIKDFKIIALSLESLQYLRDQKNIDYNHVWELMEMEEIFHNSFLKSQKAVEEWKSVFGGREDGFYDEAFGYEFDFYVSYHSFVCIIVAEKLRDLFLKENWTYLAPSVHLVFHSAYFPDSPKAAPDNFLFKFLSIDVFKRAGIKIRHISLFGRLKISVAASVLFLYIVYKLIWDAAEHVRSMIVRAPDITAALKGAGCRADVVISGWGSNHSRILSWERIQEEFQKNGGLSFFNLVWRPEKVPGFEKNKMSGNPKFIVVRENIKMDAAYGPKLSMFSLLFWPRYIYLLFVKIIPPRFYWIFWKRGAGYDTLGNLFKYRAIRLNMAFNVFFSYRSVFLTDELLDRVFVKTKPRFFIGSDSGAANSRGEILLAKRKKIITLSTPHGYQAYSMPAYNYLADYILTHSSATRDAIAALGIAPEKIVAIGTSHPKKLSPKPIARDTISIAIGTRSRGGLWSNYSSRHNDYDREFRGLLQLLAKESKFKVIIKSHPNGDYHTYYDLVIKEVNSPLVTHIPQGWKFDEFYRRCDVLVCIGEMPSFFISALYLQIPIVFIENTMTKTLKSLNYNYRGCAAVTSSFQEAAAEIKKLTKDADYRKIAITKQNEFAGSFIKDNPEHNIVGFLRKLV